MRLALLILFASVAYAQWQPVPSTNFPALEAILNAKPAVNSGTSLPSTCTALKDFYLRTADSTAWWCTGTNTWTQLATGAGGGGGGTVPAYATATCSGSATLTSTSTSIQIFQMTVTANCTSITLNGTTPSEFILATCENSTGGFSVTLPSSLQGSDPIETSASSCTTQQYRYDGTNYQASAKAAYKCASCNGTLVDGSGNIYTLPTTSSTKALAATDTPINTSQLPNNLNNFIPSGPSGGANTYYFPQIANTTMAYDVAAPGIINLTTITITAHTCEGTALTLAASGASPSTPKYDRVSWSYASDPTGVTGYGGGSGGILKIQAWIEADIIKVKRCNESGSDITPGAMTLNAGVIR